ncbi:cellulose biosynthesis cyclic di-GMP-binding regulatory protein BcsB [Neorhizobium lilium]|nr:cellulose biosynthesis cyclic di-GMP-binding regulatory protein BcsB [Neorhizobium lilium]
MNKAALLVLLTCLSASSAWAQTPVPAPFDMGPEQGRQAPPAAAPAPSTPSAPIPAAPPRPLSRDIPLTPPRQALPSRPVTPTPPAPAAQATAPSQAKTSEPVDLGRRYLVPSGSLRLAGEVEQRSWSVYLTAEQAASPAKLHFAYKNSIFVAPEVSNLRITVNDVQLYAKRIASSDQSTEQAVTVPAGVLKAGANLIRFRADQRHRTDCTVESTFELWTDIDPKKTFLSFDNKQSGRFTRLDDLRAVGLDGQGRTRFRLIVPSLDQLGATDVLMRLAQGLALTGGMPNQSFSLQKQVSGTLQPGELAVFVGTPDELRPQLPNVASVASAAAIASFVDYPGGNGASALVLSGPTWPSIQGLIESFVTSTDGSATQRREALSTLSWNGVDTPLLFGGGLVNFANMGVAGEEFSGRLYRTRFTIGVPADFYANAYGEARILLDAAYSASVLPGSHIDVLVNGNLASTVPITSTGGAILRHLPIKLTLRHFKPGVNTIVIEAALMTAADKACAPGATADDKSRFALFGSSQFEMPDFARIAQIPNLSAVAGTGYPYANSREPVSLFLGRIDEKTLSSAATFLGKTAVASHRIMPVGVTISAARAAGRDALFVGSISEFPANVLSQLKIDEDSRNSWNPDGGSQAPSASSLTLRDWQDRTGNNFLSRQFSALADWAKENFDLSATMLRFAPATNEMYKPPSTAKMIVAQESDPTGLGTWTAIISPSGDALAEGMEQFAMQDNWDALKGRIAIYGGADVPVDTVAVSWFRFLPTQSLSFTNARLIAANWLSDNIMSYSLLLAASAVLVGLATTGLLSRIGRE